LTAEKQPRGGSLIYVRTPRDCRQYEDGFQDLRGSSAVGKNATAASVSAVSALAVEQALDVQVARIYVRTPADCREYSDSFGALGDAGDDVDAGGNN
ncbi:hypothetical protein H0H92_013660, partial [Tricholoma furcatifolium]